MRLFAVAGLLAVSSFAAAQFSGIYQPAGGAAVQWQINQDRTLIWGNQNYLPEGLHIAGTPDAIAAAKKAGFQDVVVDLPPSGQGWKEAFAALEAAGMRYLISIDSLAPSAVGFTVEPESYRVNGVTAGQHVEFPLRGATSALVLVVTERDASIQSTERVPIMNGKFLYDVKVPGELEQVLLVYPEQSDASHADYWEGFDSQRDMLLSSLQQFKPGKGLRGIVNPVGRLFKPQSDSTGFVPESPYFRMQLRAYLESRYRDLQTAERAWTLGTNDIDSFDGMARLVPLWSGLRGVGQMWDPSNDHLIECDDKRSLAWTDIRSVIESAAAQRFQRLVPAVQSVVDVPVLQDWSGWQPPCELEIPVLSGIGFRAAGRGLQDVIDSAARPVSSAMRWKTPGWLVCTDMNIDRDAAAGADIVPVLNSLAEMGVRGFFVRTSAKDVVSALVSDASSRSGDANYAPLSPTALFFPENAYNPASPRVIVGTKWWLPSPADGQRLTFVGGIFGYRFAEGGGNYSTVLWAKVPMRVRLRTLSPKTATITTSDGSDPKVRRLKNALELNLTAAPLTISGIDDLPVPENGYLELAKRFQQLLAFGDQMHKDVAEDGYAYHNIVASFERDPGNSFLQLQHQFSLLNRKLGRFVWVEGENSRDNTFSGSMPLPGCSNGAALALRTPVTIDPHGFYAAYDIPVLSDETQEIWIAARIPEDERPYVVLDAGGQKLHIGEDPIGAYSNGFAWYHMGSVKLVGPAAKLTVQVLSPQGIDIALDAILVSPVPFTPNGVTMPEAIKFDQPVKPVKRR